MNFFFDFSNAKIAELTDLENTPINAQLQACALTPARIYRVPDLISDEKIMNATFLNQRKFKKYNHIKNAATE